MIEQPDAAAYDDPDLKDLVGDMPRMFCALTSPPAELKASEALRCLGRSAPCWHAIERPDGSADQTAEELPPAPFGSDPED